MAAGVLIIDGHRARSQLTARWLQEAGHRVTCTHDAWSGYLALRASRPELVLVDGGVGNLADRQVLSQLWQALAEARIPVVVLALGERKTGTASMVRPQLLLDQGRPYVSHRLLHTVERALCERLDRAERHLRARRRQAHPSAA